MTPPLVVAVEPPPHPGGSDEEVWLGPDRSAGIQPPCCSWGASPPTTFTPSPTSCFSTSVRGGEGAGARMSGCAGGRAPPHESDGEGVAVRGRGGGGGYEVWECAG